MQDIISTFSSNYDLFAQIADYIDRSPDSFYFCKTTEKFYVRKNGEDIDISNIEIDNQILEIINQLQYEAIIESDNNIVFIRQSGEIEKDVIYMKGEEIPTTYNNIVNIKANWYYYQTSHN